MTDSHTAPYRSWCDDAEKGAVEQMENAVRLPVSVAGALMPDAHQGYGLPIGGVLATTGAIIPCAVSMDTAFSEGISSRSSRGRRSDSTRRGEFEVGCRRVLQ